MNTSAKAVRFDDNSMWVDLSDGRTLGIPLVWFPRLLHATPQLSIAAAKEPPNCRHNGASSGVVFRVADAVSFTSFWGLLQRRVLVH
jgi:Protein of unknown function (DUF2442)